MTLAGAESATLSLEATVGRTGRGDIAVDSVTVRPGPCVTLPATAAPFRAARSDRLEQR